MILWKISTAISIKHRILATFNIKKNQSEWLYAFKQNEYIKNTTRLIIEKLIHIIDTNNSNHGNKMYRLKTISKYKFEYKHYLTRMKKFFYTTVIFAPL